MRTTGFVGLLLALAAGYFVYSAQLDRTSSAGASPQQTIDITAIRSALFEIGQAQRLYVNAHGAYGTLEQLRAEGSPHLGSDQRGYVFSVKPDGARGFRAIAAPAGARGEQSPTLTIDERMEITRQ